MTNIYEQLGPQARRRQGIVNVLCYGVAGAAIVLGVLWLGEIGFWTDHDWPVLLQWDLLSLLLQGLAKTLQVAAIATVLSLLAGAVLAAGRLSEAAAVRRSVAAFIEVFRGLPPLLFIFAIFLGLPALGITTNTFWTLVLGLTLYNAPSVAEIYRAGVKSLPVGQTEAGYAVGLRKSECFRHILLPQAIKPMIPALVSQVIMIVKETALGFIIGYNDMVSLGQSAVEFLGSEAAIPVYTLIAWIYICICLVLSAIAALLSSRWGDTVSKQAGSPTGPSPMTGEPPASTILVGASNQRT